MKIVAVARGAYQFNRGRTIFMKKKVCMSLVIKAIFFYVRLMSLRHKFYIEICAKIVSTIFVMIINFLKFLKGEKIMVRTTIDLDEKSRRIIEKMQEEMTFIGDIKSAINFALYFWEKYSRNIEDIQDFLLKYAAETKNSK